MGVVDDCIHDSVLEMEPFVVVRISGDAQLQWLSMQHFIHQCSMIRQACTALKSAWLVVSTTLPTKHAAAAQSFDIDTATKHAMPLTFFRFLPSSLRGWMGCDLSIFPGHGSLYCVPLPHPLGHLKPVLRLRSSRTLFKYCGAAHKQATDARCQAELSLCWLPVSLLL